MSRKLKVIYSSIKSSLSRLFKITGMSLNKEEERLSTTYTVSPEDKNKMEITETCASFHSGQEVGRVCFCVNEAGGSVNHLRAPVCCPWTPGTQLILS